MKIENKITTAVINALQALYGITPDTSTVQLQKTKKEFEGHLTLVVFPFLKASRKNPEATATEIGEYLVKNESAVASYNVIKGFLNLVIASNCWIDQLNDINENDEWMPGYIVIFNNNKHIGIVSNYRNKDGVTYILHNGGQPVREEDYLKRGIVVAHYRFDAEKIPDNVLYKMN